MFSSKLSPLIVKYPTEADAFKRLAEFFLRIERAPDKQLSRVRINLSRLADIIDINNDSDLMDVVQLLIKERVLRRVIVVMSPGGGGIAEYESYAEVPEVIQDPRRDYSEFAVSAEHIETVYRPVLA